MASDLCWPLLAADMQISTSAETFDNSTTQTRESFPRRPFSLWLFSSLYSWRHRVHCETIFSLHINHHDALMRILQSTPKKVLEIRSLCDELVYSAFSGTRALCDRSKLWLILTIGERRVKRVWHLHTLFAAKRVNMMDGGMGEWKTNKQQCGVAAKICMVDWWTPHSHATREVIT